MPTSASTDVISRWIIFQKVGCFAKICNLTVENDEKTNLILFLLSSVIDKIFYRKLKSKYAMLTQFVCSFSDTVFFYFRISFGK